MNETEFRPEKEISAEELQTFLNDPSLDLPQARRDITVPGNIAWLLRNIYFRNSEKISNAHYKALKNLFKNQNK